MFSEREEKILKILRRDKRTKLEDISNKIFNKPNIPFDAAISVANSIRRIIKKCEFYDLAWSLDKCRIDNKMTVRRIRRLEKK